MMILRGGAPPFRALVAIRPLSNSRNPVYSCMGVSRTAIARREPLGPHPLVPR